MTLSCWAPALVDQGGDEGREGREGREQVIGEGRMESNPHPTQTQTQTHNHGPGHPHPNDLDNRSSVWGGDTGDKRRLTLDMLLPK